MRPTLDGHGDGAPQTEAIHRRYAITDEAMLREGAEKLARRREEQRAAPPTTKIISAEFGT